MKKTLFIGLALSGLFFWAGCGKKTDKANISDTTLNTTAGCASCIYKMPGIKGCVTAVKVDNKAMLLSGVKHDAHKTGLCDEEKKAKITGHIEGDHFLASDIKIL